MGLSYLETVLARAERATKAPWVVRKTGMISTHRSVDPILGSHNHTPYIQDNNADFIAHSRTDVPELVKRLQFSIQLLRHMAKDGGFEIEHVITNKLESHPNESEEK